MAPSAGTSCTYDTSSPTWVTVASNVSSLQFVPWYQGSAGVAPATATSGGSCAGATGSVNAPDNCLFDSIELKVTELGVAQGNNQSEPSSMDQTFSVSLANSKLV